ncbi:BZ3500_MvSof-1268-A1-R1_Chr3-1g05878 [Microbotryum saponariae]|uniref:BZ3500_MvSof-1268-A1-R1_Chr3-1g05878 protein n=1 Tax=Microbotryum saponariae TaxID=289078 RepID=A0A2X0L445_9BASI|nr:BZ3500_MvSof-1268-A1-R1_Chr3-1g05878 [Microbotryum saponariae]SDA05068.1 BZ3501_MvSof-1269-A2-R1_Chr3-1g05548 [Microbotryum saponariae]
MPTEKLWPIEHCVDADLEQAVLNAPKLGAVRSLSASRLAPPHGIAKVVIGSVLLAGVILLQLHPVSFQICMHRKSSSSIDWQPCAQNASWSCAHITVPKNYLDLSAGKAHIAVLKVPSTAAREDRLGSIFVNPGGPGNSGVNFIASFGEYISQLVKGRYDVIGFDPRGVGRTEPLVECFSSTFDHELFKAHTVLEHGFDVHPDPKSPAGRRHLIEQHQERMELMKAEYERCGEMMGDELRYMSTPTVARDIVEMTEQLEGKGALVHYYGFSYGTILGQFLLNMFPDRVGRVIIDGVVDAKQWAETNSPVWLHDWLNSTEAAYEWFLSDCHRAGPRHCPLAHYGDESPSAISQRIFDFVDHLYDHPLAVPDGARPGILSSGAARSQVYGLTNRPAFWRTDAARIAAMLDGNVTEVFNAIYVPFSPHDRRGQLDLSRIAVACGDTIGYESEADYPTAEYLAEQTYRALETSPHFGASVSLIEPDGSCEYWPASRKTPERFNGPWNSKLKNKVLIIGNTADPITPLTSARKANARFTDSTRLLIQNSPGHCSFGGVSTCTAKYFRNYFLTGELPEKDEIVCELDQGYFDSLDPEHDGERVDEELELFELGKAITSRWGAFLSNLQ